MKNLRFRTWAGLSALLFAAAGLSLPQTHPTPKLHNGSLHMGGLHLAVRDLETSKLFYRDSLELPLTVEEPGHRAGFQGGLLWLGPERLTASQTPSPITVVLFTRSAEKAYRNLKARGLDIPFPPDDHAEGKRSFSFKDPDGYRIEVVEPLALGFPARKPLN
jgi:catechol 2,3-dioxygenase-like lactoylglutathione lyase family enzyme